MIELILLSLSTYGIATLIAHYSGPFDIFYRLRKVRKLSGALECNVCLGVWVAIPLTLLLGLSVFYYLATIGIVIIVSEMRD